MRRLSEAHFSGVGAKHDCRFKQVLAACLYKQPIDCETTGVRTWI